MTLHFARIFLFQYLSAGGLASAEGCQKQEELEMFTILTREAREAREARATCESREPANIIPAISESKF